MMAKEHFAASQLSGLSLSSSDSEGDDGDDCGSEHEDDTIGVNVKCLFCDEQTPTTTAVMSHMSEAHSLDFGALKTKYSMDQMSFIKMVNWMRSLKTQLPLEKFGSCSENLALIGLQTVLLGPPVIGEGTLSSPPWKDDKWLQPQQEDDLLLTFWFDSDISEPMPVGRTGLADYRSEYQGAGDSSTINLPSKSAIELELALLSALDEQLVMKDTVLRLMEDNDDKKNKILQKLKTAQSRSKSNTSDSDSNQEVDYFESYDGLEIHHSMLKDNSRTMAYMNAIKLNESTFKGKTVLDLGCGTGILSMFCADAGAKTVYAVDQSKMIYEAMDICFENNKENQIRFISRKLEDVSQDEVEKVDVIVSEFMGYFLLFEGMTTSFLYARDKFLKQGGKLFPNKASMFMVGLSDEERYANEVGMWDNVYGYKMSTLRKKVLQEAYVINVGSNDMCSKEVTLKNFDFHTCVASDLKIDDIFELGITRSCNLTAICGYFNVAFEEGSTHKEILSTGPADAETHWKQAIFYLPSPLSVTAGEKLKVYFKCVPHPEFERWLQISLKIGDMSASYDMK